MKTDYCKKLLFLALFVVACTENPGVALPEVPVVSTTQMRAVARQQIEKAYADAARKPKDIAAVAELALVLHAYGYDAAAEIAYRRSLALRPNDVRLIYLRSLVVQQLGRSDEALAGYRSMTGDEEFGARAWARIADIQLMNGDWREALTAADAGLHTVAGDSELRYLRGRALAELGEIEAADAVFREVLDSGAQQPSLYYSAARTARALGDAESATSHITAFERTRDSGRSWPDKLIGAVHAKRLTARSLVEQSQNKLARGGSIKEAISTLENAVEIDSEAYEADIALIGLYGSQGQFRQVDRHIGRAMQLAPNVAQLHFNIGMARVNQKRNADAIMAFSRAIELNPTDAKAHAFLGQVHDMENNPEEAIRLFEKAVAFAPNDMLVRQMYAPLLLREKRYGRALEILSLADPLPRGETGRQLLRGKALSLSGDSAGAREALALARTAADNSGDPRMVKQVADAAQEMRVIDE